MERVLDSIQFSFAVQGGCGPDNIYDRLLGVFEKQESRHPYHSDKSALVFSLHESLSAAL